MALVETFLEISRGFEPVVVEMLTFLGPVWVAFLFGVMVGWAWKPRWASLGSCKFDWSIPSNPSAMGLLTSPVKSQSSDSNQSLQRQPGGVDRKVDEEPQLTQDPNCSSSAVKPEENHHVVTDEDLRHLWRLVERKDGGPSWKHMMDRSAPGMTYQAWQRDPETGPPQYCSRTVYEDATPELLRDFFWDDDFRLKWDDMLLHASIEEESPATGASIVHWIRKFPFFCSDREYTIGRRIWELGRSYYCVTKGVPCPKVPRKQKPRRVDLYYSSWFIKSVRSEKGKEQPACEVMFFHHEDMGIPWEIAKFGVRQGMWGAAQKVERGLRWYQKERAQSKTVSAHVVMARMATRTDTDHLTALEPAADVGRAETGPDGPGPDVKRGGVSLPKVLLVGGAVVLACSLDRGLLTKAVIFGVARRFVNIGRRVGPGPGPRPRT